MKFVSNIWYGAVWSQNLMQTPVARRILDKPIVLFRGRDGAAVALDDVCPHRFVPLSRGKIIGNGHLRCGYHGLEFDESGACVRNPNTSGRIPPAAKVRAYPVVERHKMVWIWMGDKAPDPSLVPDFSHLDNTDPKLTSDLGCLEFDANYTFLVENLLDLSHVGVLHEGLLGNEAALKAELKVQQDEAGNIVVSRDMFNIPVPEVLDLLYRNDGRPVDHWSDIKLLGISCVSNNVGIVEAGKGRSPEATGLIGTHILTPINERRTLYQFCAVRVNPPQRSGDEDAQIRQKLSNLRTIAFAEQDGPMIRAQQLAYEDQVIDKSRPALFDVDLAASRFQRRIRELLSAEESPATTS
jgi:vanillate O-demethylase monooxygenase subunit